MKVTKKQIENVQTDYGIVFVDYGETTQVRLGPTRGGGEFSATATIRAIEFDGMRGKTKEMQVIDEINAMLKTSIGDTSLDTLAKLMPHLKLVEPGGEAAPYIVNATPGLIPGSEYVKNVTMFAKTLGGKYKRITIFNPMAENPLTLSAAPKAEGVVALEIHAHWDISETAIDPDLLFKIEDVDAITETVPE